MIIQEAVNHHGGENLILCFQFHGSGGVFLNPGWDGVIRNHQRHIVLHRVHVGADIVKNLIVGAGAGPVAAKLVIAQGSHYGPGIVEPLSPRRLIAVIPEPQSLPGNAGILRHLQILFKQPVHLFIGKAEVLAVLDSGSHGILKKHIQLRPAGVFRNGKDARHIGQLHVSIILQKIAEKLGEAILILLGDEILMVDIVPLVQHEDKFLAAAVFIHLCQGVP